MKPAADFTIRAQQWLHSGEAGVSSEAIFHYMTLGIKGGATPSDPSDLGRCIRLLDRFPEWKSRMPEMASVSDDWAMLMPHWDEAVALHHKEEETAVRDRWGSWSAPRTYALLSGIFYEREEGRLRRRKRRDRDGSGEAGQTAEQAGPKATAQAEGIAQSISRDAQTPPEDTP